MKPVLAVFPSRNSADQAVSEMLKEDVPQHAVAVLTAAEEHSCIFAGQLGLFVGALAGAGFGMSVGVLTALRLGLDDGWNLLLLGFGTAALIGLCAGVIGRLICKAAADPGENSTAEFRRDHAAVIVTTESPEVASCANRVLARRASA